LRKEDDDHRMKSLVWFGFLVFLPLYEKYERKEFWLEFAKIDYEVLEFLIRQKCFETETGGNDMNFVSPLWLGLCRAFEF